MSAAGSKETPTSDATASETAASWSYPARADLVQAYAALGRCDDAARNLKDAQQRAGRT